MWHGMAKDDIFMCHCTCFPLGNTLRSYTGGTYVLHDILGLIVHVVEVIGWWMQRLDDIFSSESTANLCVTIWWNFDTLGNFDVVLCHLDASHVLHVGGIPIASMRMPQLHIRVMVWLISIVRLVFDHLGSARYHRNFAARSSINLVCDSDT